MSVKDFFDKIMMRNVKEQSMYDAPVYNYEYAGFRAIEALVLDEVHDYFKENNPRLYEEHRDEVRYIVKLTVGATVLALAFKMMRGLQSSSAIARSLPEDQVLWQQVQILLLGNEFIMSHSKDVRNNGGN